MSEYSSPRRGEIWYVNFSPSRGSEQAGKRPALVIQNDAGNTNPRYPNTIVLAMSTKGKRVPFHVKIDPAKSTGLQETTFVKCEQILTIAKARLIGKCPLGRVSAGEIRKVEAATLLAIGIGLRVTAPNSRETRRTG
jgi:mRNA interferase MazF